ncbi:MAG: hypothetical protein QY310_06580 [Candidatus Jettenia sp. CY-1]|nr:MAG: hypothetical protein QY310_06580 [Candidatus Jettenia sp. CY-1]
MVNRVKSGDTVTVAILTFTRNDIRPLECKRYCMFGNLQHNIGLSRGIKGPQSKATSRNDSSIKVIK